jgi:hypothetical protein
VNSDDLEQLPFFRHGRDPNCDPEIAYTIVELMDQVEQHCEDDDVKLKPGYLAHVSPTRLETAWALLQSKRSLNLHGFGPRKKITSLVPLGGMPSIERLFLAWNSIEDILPLASVPRLQSLSLKKNQVSDISAIASCRQLVDLDLSENPVQDLAPLDGLPALRKLTLSTSQAEGLARCKTLPALSELHISGDGTSPPLTNFPSMPQLRWLELNGVTSLAGVERYPLIESVHFSGNDYDLSPVSNLRYLVTATFWSKASFDLAALRQCAELRYLNLIPALVTGMEALEGLPHLHEVFLGRETQFDRAFAERLRSKLTPWDTEFGRSAESFVPQLQVEVVSQTEFDRCDNEPFGVTPGGYEALLHHERTWMLNRLEKAIARAGFKTDERAKPDVVMPCKNYGGRSHTVVAYSLKAHRSFRRLATLIQEQINCSKLSWIFYFLSLIEEGDDAERIPEGTRDFIVWVHRDKLVTTEKYAATVQALLDAKPSLLDRVSSSWRR